MVPIYWGLAFIVLNMLWIIYLLLERRPVKLSKEDQRLYQLVFRTLTPREMLRLLNLAQWEDKATGEILETQGEPQDRLGIIVSGRGEVRSRDRRVGEIGEGQFVGKISFMSEEIAPVSVVALQPIRYVSWRKQELRRFLKSKPELAAALGLILGLDLRAMLEVAWGLAAATETKRDENQLVGSEKPASGGNVAVNADVVAGRGRDAGRGG